MRRTYICTFVAPFGKLVRGKGEQDGASAAAGLDFSLPNLLVLNMETGVPYLA